MAETLYFVHSDVIAAEELARPYGERGWGTVISAPNAEDAYDRAADCRPIAAVISLEGPAADDARALGLRLTQEEDFPKPLMVFLGGSADQVALMKEALPYALFVKPEELAWVLKHLSFKG